MENINPLLCDFKAGACEMPGSASPSGAITAYEEKLKPVQITYFTDPICSSCWGIEPQLRKLKLEYGSYIDIAYHMGGLLPSWQGFSSGGITKPADVAHHWDQASRYYQMPIDGDIWLEDPLDSSYPPSIAFIAAVIQDRVKAEQFLRRIKEMVFLEKKNIAKWEHLRQAAVETGLDPERFKQDFEGDAVKLFQVDLDLARAMRVRSFPTLFFVNKEGQQQVMIGSKPYGHFEQTILALVPDAKKELTANSAEAIFAHYPTLTTQEFSVITSRPLEQAQALLQSLADNERAAKVPGRNGAIWRRTQIEN